MNESRPRPATTPTPASDTGPGNLPPTGRARRRGSRLRPLLAVVAALIGLAVLGHWLYGRLTHVVVYDARIEADVVTVSSRVAGWVTGLPVETGRFGADMRVELMNDGPLTIVIESPA